MQQSLARKTVRLIHHKLNQIKSTQLRHSKIRNVIEHHSDSNDEADNGNTISFEQLMTTNNGLSECILNHFDDDSIFIFARLNKKCHQIKTKNVKKYININSNDWMLKYFKNAQHAILHMIESEKIILDFSNIQRINVNSLITTLDKMRHRNIFKKCKSLSIISPSPTVSKLLYESIGSLHSVKQLLFENIEIFPMLSIIKNVRCGLKRISMCDIEISKSDKDESVEWIDAHCNGEHIKAFIERLMECNYIKISGWSNKHNFWNKYLDDIHQTFDVCKKSKLSMALQHSLEHCCIKHLVYLPKYPKQDRIPHVLVKFLLKFKGEQIEKLNLHFAASSKLYHATIKKAVKQKLAMKALRELDFAWNDKDSYKLLKCFGKEMNLEKVKLTLPESRDLSKLEEKTVASIKRVCENVCIQRRENGILITDSQEY